MVHLQGVPNPNHNKGPWPSKLRYRTFLRTPPVTPLQIVPSIFDAVSLLFLLYSILCGSTVYALMKDAGTLFAL